MGYPQSAAAFEFDTQAVFIPGMMTRSKTKANKTMQRKAGDSSSLIELPVDVHSYVLTFLDRNELAHYSEISRACRAVATLDTCGNTSSLTNSRTSSLMGAAH
jgi:hypothetical protein